MQIFNDLSNLPKVESTILTLGIFDGVHLGHKKIFEKLKKKAASLNCRNLIITFSPHPRNVISGKGEIMLLTTIEEKIKLFEESGIEKERLRMINVSAAGAINLVEKINEMVTTIKELGPNPVRKTIDASGGDYKEFETLNSHQ